MKVKIQEITLITVVLEDLGREVTRAVVLVAMQEEQAVVLVELVVEKIVIAVIRMMAVVKMRGIAESMMTIWES